MSDVGYSQEELEEAGLTDFRVFLCEVWHHLQLPRPTPLQLDIAYWLQHGPQKIILQAFRGVGKSYITVAFVLWLLLLDPQKKVMVVSANDDLAADFTKLCLQLIKEMPLLQHLEPRPGQLRRTDKFDVGPARASKNPSIKSVGIHGQITGSRANIIVADDIEIPKNSMTPLMRDRIANLVKEFSAVLLPLEDSRIIYLGTPQVEESLYIRLERERGYTTRIWSIEVPEKPTQYRNRLAPSIMRAIENGAPAHTPLEPTRFNEAEIMSRRTEYGAAGFALQFMLDTTPSDKDAHPLKLHDLIVHDCNPTIGPVQIVWGGSPALTINDLPSGGFDGDHYHRPAWLSPEMAKYQQTVMAIDPSGRGKDETAYAIVKYLNGILYLLDIGGFVDGFGEETMKALAGKALRWGVNDIIIEENYGGGMFNQLLKPWLIKVYGEQHEGKLGAAGKIDEEWNGWSSNMKEMRICDTLQPIVESHRLVIDRRVLEDDFKLQSDRQNYSFVYQFTRIARIKGALVHDDRLESLSMAAAYVKDKMDRDQKRAHDQHKESLQDAELRKFARSVFGLGARAARPNWIK